METLEMGRVLTEATIYNVHDYAAAKAGKLPADQVCKLTVPDALVDTGATSLALTKSLIDQLGLVKLSEKRAATATGVRTMNVYGTVRLEIMGRDVATDVIEVPEGNPVLIGQIPLEWMDWVVDMKGRRLIGNPAHGGEHVLEVL